MFALPLAVGNLGAENCLRRNSLLGALVLRPCHVTVRCWEPLCEELFVLPIARFCGVLEPSWRSFGGPFGVLLELFWALSGPPGSFWAFLGLYFSYIFLHFGNSSHIITTTADNL